MAETAANTFSYSQEEEKYIIRNKGLFAVEGVGG